MQGQSLTSISENSSAEELVGLLRGDEATSMPDGWWEWPAVHEAHRRLASELLESMPAYPERFVGRGIVICAGGHGLFTNGYVCASMLRHLGCVMPIQFWHLDDEMDASMAQIVAPLGVACINANEIDRRNERKARILNGFELKPFAILHSPFQEVLLLDADNVAVVDPTFLFGAPEYEQTGAVFWPDYGRLKRSRKIWRICEVAYRDEPEFESGQIVVDKKRCWRALNLAMHYNEHSDFYYRHIHGDKDTFHMAFHRTETPYAMPRRRIHSLDATMCQHDFEGHRIFQHRNMDKWRLDGSNRAIGGFWFEDFCRYFLSELRARWSGRVYGSPPANEEQARAFEQIKDTLFRYVRVGYDQRALQLKADGTIGKGAAACERFWAVNEMDGRVVLTILGESSPTCHLCAEDGIWKGEWLHHEKMPIELIPDAEKA